MSGLLIEIHPHAKDRAKERGTTEEEIIVTLQSGETFAAKHGRTGFRRNFPYETEWNGVFYHNKQVEAYAAEENSKWIVITVIVKYF